MKNSYFKWLLFLNDKIYRKNKLNKFNFFLCHLYRRTEEIRKFSN